MRCETKHALCISSRVKRTAYPEKPTTNTVSQTTPHLVKLTIRQQTVQVAATASRSSRPDKLTIRQQTVSASGCNCTTLKQIRPLPSAVQIGAGDCPHAGRSPPPLNHHLFTKFRSSELRLLVIQSSFHVGPAAQQQQILLHACPQYDDLRQNDRDLLRATAVPRGWSGYRNKSEHRKFTFEKKVLLLLLPGIEPATFRSRVWCSNH